MSNALLVARAVHKTYDIGRVALRVLRGCDLRLEAGESVAVMGKSGSGKSTLLHILGALDVPEAGHVEFAGQPIFAPQGRRRLRTGVTDVFVSAERHRTDLRRHQFGFVFQQYHLLPELNVLENVLIARMVGTSTWSWMLDRKTPRDDAVAILERVGLGERLKHRPNELSGGERQRVAIARALVHRPRILYADEPTGNLDAEAGARLMELLDDLHRDGQTIVMVTHDPGIAAHADRVLQLEEGRLRSA
jgi:lipoprotein-releasing system ATP-binding protein